jgi:UDP-N-acetylmuramoyl-tripeptide--D-alanyl-D-alanine ligase
MNTLLRTEIAAVLLTASLIAFTAPVLSQTDRINLAVTHLGNMQQSNGFFRYQLDFLTGRWSMDNNIVRQAGAGYALGEYLLVHRNPVTEKQLRQAISAYSRSSMQWKDGRLLTVEGNYKKAKAGATALALISALYYRQATGDTRFDPDIDAWTKGLLSLRNNNAGFARRPRKSLESPYSNGEIWLAFGIYAQQFPEQAQVLETLRQIDDYFLEHYSKEPDIGFFHWGLMAAEKRFQQTGERRFVDFAVQQTNYYLDEMRPRVSQNSNSCYAVEGMTAVYAMLQGFPEHSGLQMRLATRIKNEMKKNLNLQIMTEQKEINLGSGRSLAAPEIADNAGAFLNGRQRPQIRIDATQHCLSAMLRARQLDPHY